MRNLNVWCNVGHSGQHCLESPNRACLEEGADCRVLLKSDNTLDMHTVETMIANASLPLVIVYTGGSMRRAYHGMAQHEAHVT